MSTVKATNFSHPSAANPAIVLDAAGGATVAGMGLVLVSPTSIANSGGSASASGGQVTFTGVSSVSLNGVFTSAYDNYKIIVNASTSNTGAINTRLRASGTDNSSSIYNYQGLVNFSTTIAAAENINQVEFSLLPNAGAAQSNCAIICDLLNPFLAKQTLVVSTNFKRRSTGGPVQDFIGGYHDSTASFDGLSFIVSSNTLTGTIRVYGYKNS